MNNKEEKASMAYIKLDQEPDDGDLPASPGAEEQSNEAASDEARAMMRDINAVTHHCDEIIAILKTIPLNTARQIAEQKAMEAKMWAVQAFIQSEM